MHSHSRFSSNIARCLRRCLALSVSGVAECMYPDSICIHIRGLVTRSSLQDAYNAICLRLVLVYAVWALYLAGERREKALMLGC